jgi:hypothetical protein
MRSIRGMSTHGDEAGCSSDEDLCPAWNGGRGIRRCSQRV